MNDPIALATSQCCMPSSFYFVLPEHLRPETFSLPHSYLVLHLQPGRAPLMARCLATIARGTAVLRVVSVLPKSWSLQSQSVACTSRLRSLASWGKSLGCSGHSGISQACFS